MRLFFLPLLFSLILLQCNSTYAQTENPLESQITSFMTGLQSENPKQTVELWVLGLNNRSGAVQYALLSPSLQRKTRKQFEERGWGTGQSSPWVDNVQITKVVNISDEKVKFTITYDLLSSYKNFGSGQKVITLEKNPETGKRTWFIIQIVTKYNQYEGFTPAETVTK
ncbi:hypothetical protein QUF73_13745 [Cytobacillus sp. NJ13]|nr:hypothetical protein [Cytobacillus sp. NJ13]